MHDIRSPLRFLGDVANSLDVKNIHDPESVDRRNIELLKETSESLYLFASNVLDWFINNKIEISMMKEQISLAEVAKEVVRVYDKPIKAKKNRLIMDLDESVYVHSNKEISAIIIRNALDNANKYTTNGEIKLKVNKDKEGVVFSIEDNGRGFDHTKLMQNIAGESEEATQHLGVRIIHDLAIQVGITYKLKSQKGVGTIFSLRYPD